MEYILGKYKIKYRGNKGGKRRNTQEEQAKCIGKTKHRGNKTEIQGKYSRNLGLKRGKTVGGTQEHRKYKAIQRNKRGKYNPNTYPISELLSLCSSSF